MSRVLIVGAGQAGASAAIALRQGGYGGGLCIIGAEPDLPYERPPLSKDYLAGEKAADRLLLRPPAFWAERSISVRTGTRITAINGQTATADSGETFAFDHLIWAAGGEARRLAIPGGDRAHVIRTRHDTDRLRLALGAQTRIAIIGGGYIGLEAAAVLTKLGHRVTLLEAQDRLLARVAGPEISAFYRAEHEAHGVGVRLGAVPEAIEDGAVRLASGGRVAADLFVAGIGLVPSVGPLAAAGADCPNGALVDRHCRTTIPHIYAIGDCALHESPFAGGSRVRLESVQNAADMGKAAAAHILEGDAAPPYHAVPWFWSNQYDLKLQTVGLSAGADARVVRGDPSSRSWSLVYLRAGAVIALDCINAAKDYRAAARLSNAARACPPNSSPISPSP